MLDVYDIVWIEVTGNGDVVKRVERILIQSRNVHCERQFGTNITVDELFNAPKFDTLGFTFDTTLGFTFGAGAHIHLPENTTHKAWMDASEIACE
jgi:hypothetical protein